MPRNYIKKKPVPTYSVEDILHAVQDIRSKNLTYRQANKRYGVPISVIYNRIHGRKIALDKMGAGPPLTFTKEVEDYMVTVIKMRSQAGYPCSKQETLELIGQYVSENQLKTKFKDGVPGEEWYKGFMKRHPELSLKKTEHLQKCRRDARKPFVIYDFYDKLENLVTSHKLLDKPEFIFNADESGFNSDASRVRGLGEKGKALVRISGGSGRENTTVLACVSALGTYLPPLIVYKGAAVQARWTSNKALPGTLYAASENGWMKEPQFFNWFVNGFIPHVQELREKSNMNEQTAILLYDGHKSHISVCIIKSAIDNKIEIIKFPSHLTDKIQPLDTCVFKGIKSTWDKILVNYGKQQMGHGTGRLTREKFAELLSETWVKKMCPENIIAGFKNTGLYPVDHTKFPVNDFDPKELKIYKVYTSLRQETEHTNEDSNDPNTTQITTITPVNNTIPNSSPTHNITETVMIPCTSNSLPNVALPNTSTYEENRSESRWDRPVTPPPSSNAAALTQEEKLSGITLAKSIIEVLNKSEIGTPLKDIIISKILPAIVDLPRSEPEVISPSKSQLMEIFGVNTSVRRNLASIENNLPNNRKVVPRLKRDKYGEVLTYSDVLKRMEDAEDAKKLKESNKGTKRKIKKTNDGASSKLSKSSPPRGINRNKKKENSEPVYKKQDIKQKKKELDSDSEENSDEIPYMESDDSINIEENISESDIEDCCTIKEKVTSTFQKNKEYKNGDKSNNLDEFTYTEGDYILCEFPGKKRTHKYVCVISKLLPENEAEIIGLKRGTNRTFKLNDSDISIIRRNQIIEKLDNPKMVISGDCISYEFVRDLNVDG